MRARTRATPPKSGGVMRSRKAMRLCSALFDRMTGRSRPHLSLREGLEQTPFPLALHRAGSVLAVKGSLRRFAPWTAAGRSERRAAYEGKGGDRAVGREGDLRILSFTKRTAPGPNTPDHPQALVPLPKTPAR